MKFMHQPAKVRDFTEVDSSDARFLIEFLDKANSLSTFQSAKPAITQRLNLNPGSNWIDVGCGTGDDTISISQSHTPNGSAVGVDISHAMVREAGERAARESAANVSFRQGDATHLPFETNAFDACRAERVLFHVADRGKAVDEMIRVTRPGGAIVGMEVDGGSTIIDHPNHQLTQKITDHMTESVAGGWAGRELPRLYRERGLEDVTVTPHTVILDFEWFNMVIGAELESSEFHSGVPEIALWWDDLRAAEGRGLFFSTFTTFIVRGTKPVL
ncbi:methyltransferase domain-containing protein [Agromyces sp. NPDC058126]|uniref:methyltransferase domain-containing protein n=1 Tax=Agromyces sp. NPDC058126 TaxID=3346350 RepID=UPI0036D8CA26